MLSGNLTTLTILSEQFFTRNTNRCLVKKLARQTNPRLLFHKHTKKSTFMHSRLYSATNKRSKNNDIFVVALVQMNWSYLMQKSPILNSEIFEEDMLSKINKTWNKNNSYLMVSLLLLQLRRTTLAYLCSNSIQVFSSLNTTSQKSVS